MRATALLKELIHTHPEWNWQDLEDQGFFEIMYAFRLVPQEDKTTIILAFTVVKEYIRRLLVLTEKQITDFKPRKLAYSHKSYNNGFNAGLREAKFLAKTNKTKVEQNYLAIITKFNLDLDTVILIWSLVNGYKKNKEQVGQWAKNKYTQYQTVESFKYYLWLSTFIEKLSPEDFAIFYDKMYVSKLVIKPKPVSRLIKKKP